jgi:hypothetical protein
MTDQLESDLRDALAARASGLPAGAGVHLRGIDYRPRTGRFSPGVMAGSLAGVAAATGVVVSVVTLAGAQPAFAGWLPRPTPATTAQMSSADSTCRGQLATSPAFKGTAAVSVWEEVATDVRGPFTLSIFQSSGADATCLTGPSMTIVSQSFTDGGRSLGAESSVSGSAGGTGRGHGGGSIAFGGSGTGSIEHVSVAHFDSGSQGPYTVVEGQVATGVTGVTLLRSDGQAVQTTTANGLFIAWWPGDQTTDSAQVTTAVGVSTQSLNLQAPPPPVGGTCGPGPSTAQPSAVCSAGAGGGSTSGGQPPSPATATGTADGPSLHSDG